MGDLPIERRVAFGVPLPTAVEQWIYIVTPKVSRPLKLMVLSSLGLTCLTHWRADAAKKAGGNTVPHTTPDDTCVDCVTYHQRPRWHCYLACWSLTANRYVIADITVRAAQMVPQLNPASDINLRGFQLDLWRDGSSNNSPVGARIHGAQRPDAELPLEFELEPSLMRLWGLTSCGNWRTDPQPKPW